MKQSTFVTFLTITLVFVILWVASNVYHTLTTSNINTQLQQQIIPIDGSFDTDTINSINNRKTTTPIFNVPNVNPTATVTPTPASANTIKKLQASQPKAPSVINTPGGQL